MHHFSVEDVLAAIQAMVIYTTMRLMHSGYAYFLANRDMIDTMQVRHLPFL